MIRFVLMLFAAALSAQAAEVLAGAAAVKITPPDGAPMSGYYYERLAQGTHDDLFARAVVIQAKGKKAALIACDLSTMTSPITAKARERIERLTGIPGDHVMISSTHTHTGPVLIGPSLPSQLSPAARAIAEKYAADLPERIAESVQRANAALRPVRIAAGTGKEDSISFNRRFFMTDGTVGWNPGKLNPKIVRPAGPIDPDVAVVSFEPTAMYVNFALHLDTVGGQQFSADFPYTLIQILEKVRPGMTGMFTIGSAGNINHINVKSKEPQKGHEEAARIGTVLAGEVLKTLTRLEAARNIEIRAKNTIVRLPLAPIDAASVAKAKELAGLFGKPNAAPFLDLVSAFKTLDIVARDGRPHEAEVQVIALGPDLAFVGLPGEIFTEIAQAIKRASPFRYTVIAELANGSVGYVPDRPAYVQGAYEVVSTRCAEGSGEMVADAALALLKELSEPKSAR